MHVVHVVLCIRRFEGSNSRAQALRHDDIVIFPSKHRVAKALGRRLRCRKG